jgi:RNA recognition motif-containing protein
MNIYVGNLPYSVRDEELRTAFEPFGQVLSAEVIFDKRTRRSRGYGFVEMADDGQARRAIESLNGQEFHGRELRVDASQPRSEKPMGAERSEGHRQPRNAGSRANAPAPAPAGGLKGFFKKIFG